MIFSLNNIANINSSIYYNELRPEPTIGVLLKTGILPTIEVSPTVGVLPTIEVNLFPQLKFNQNLQNKSLTLQIITESGDTFIIYDYANHAPSLLSFERELNNFIHEMFASQVPPDPEIDKYVSDNIWKYL
jgi:hypothetical protein